MLTEKITRRNFIKLSGLTSLYLTGLFKGLKFNNILAISDDNGKICEDKFALFKSKSLLSKPIGEGVVEIGRSFLNTEYAANTLEINPDNEQLVINFSGFDCVTFVENCLTFEECLKSGKTTFDDFKSELMKIRYRNGNLDGYTSRLHYFCDWIFDNERKGIVSNVTKEMGGVEYEKNIDFMSTHVQSYPQLADKAALQKVKDIEKEINNRKHYYIPIKNLREISDILQNGDIIATTTSIKGLDVTHTGYVYKGDDGGTYFLHASLKYKKVIISGNYLADYIEEDQKKTGIMVARPAEV